jgi:hypothetical protein
VSVGLLGRYAAQIDRINGARERAQSLLERGCHTYDEVNTCVDLASLYQSAGDLGPARVLIGKWCEEGKRGWMTVPGGPQACRLERRFQAGWRPADLNEIFSDPVDGSECTGAP